MKKNIGISYEELNNWKDLSEKDQLLVEAAIKVRKSAYAPYSKFTVGACILLSNGDIVTGSNQENIAYPSGLCAERVALFYAGANFSDQYVDTLCIVAKGNLVPVETILSPCGGCRQVMAETEKRQKRPYRVILVCQNDVTLVFDSATDLLPLAFGV